VISLTYNMIDRSLCPLCLCGSFHPLALEECILEYILPTKPGRAGKLENSLKLLIHDLKFKDVPVPYTFA
jgi:hypothetical protein